MPKPKIHPMARLWPGLPQLWHRGSWAGLAVAVGFTALASTLLLATCVFHQWLTANALRIGFTVLAVVWLAAWWQSDTRRGHAGRSTDTTILGSAKQVITKVGEAQRDQLYHEAQREYLKNDWVRAEQLLLKLLKQDGGDVESRLMLATLWRHQGRDAEAIRQLDRLERLEAASRWQYEIDAVRHSLLERAASEGARSEQVLSETAPSRSKDVADKKTLLNNNAVSDNAVSENNEADLSAPDKQQSTTAAPHRRLAA